MMEQAEARDAAAGAGDPANFGAATAADDDSSFTIAVEAEPAVGSQGSAQAEKDTMSTGGAAKAAPQQGLPTGVDIEWVEVPRAPGGQGEAQSREPSVQLEDSVGAAAAREGTEAFEVVEKEPAAEAAGDLEPAVEDFVAANAWLEGFEQLLAEREPGQAPPSESAPPASVDALPSTFTPGMGAEPSDEFWVPIESWGTKKRGARATAPAEKLIPVDVVDEEG